MIQYIDKSALIAEIDRIQNTTMDKNNNFTSSYDEGKFDALTLLENYIDTLEVKEAEEEPVNKDLEEAAKIYTISLVVNEIIPDATVKQLREVADKSFKAGANWQKEQMMGAAIKGIARPLDDEVWCDGDEFPKNIQDGDKVKVLIIKENKLWV